MPRPGISARQSTPSRNRFRKRVQPATRMPSPLVKGFSPLFNPTPLSAKIQTENDMELWGNGVMNSLAQHSNTPFSNTSIPHHQQGRYFCSGRAALLYLCRYRSRHLHARHTFCEVVLAATRRGCSELQIVIGERNEGALRFSQATDGVSLDFLRRSGRTFSTSASAVMPCFFRRIGTAPCSMN